MACLNEAMGKGRKTLVLVIAKLRKKYTQLEQENYQLRMENDLLKKWHALMKQWEKEGRH